jgi:predicted lipoprotein with Yx(FWY)xxD motif
MRALALLPMALLALVAVGCGDKSAKGAEGATATSSAKGAEGATATSSAKPGARVKVVRSDYGRVIANRRGEAFYLFGKERGKKSKCYGACARAWPPVLTKGRPVAIGGAKQRLLGTTKRKNRKRQVTYAGHPLYYYVHDSPGQILCHNVAEFGGRWLVVKPNGRPAA